MQFLISEEDRNKSGIYVIRVEGGSGVYVGSACDFYTRFRKHLADIRKNKHHCIALQRAIEKHGLDSAYLEILETCNRENLLSREQYWFSQFPILYNSAKTAGSLLGMKFGYKIGPKFSKDGDFIGYYGVHWNKNLERWAVTVRVDGKTLHIGYYSSAEEANDAHIDFRISGKISKLSTRRNNKSGYPGVIWRSDREKWQAYLNKNGNRYKLGCFNSPEEAHQARQQFIESNYDTTSLQTWGGFRNRDLSEP